MYEKILVALDHTSADQSLLPHVTALAKIHCSHLLLLHVAEGWVARNYETLQLKESEEMLLDKKRLENTTKSLQQQGVNASYHLALGNPPEEILNIAQKEKCALIAMTSHGHRFLGDLFLGSTIEKVRHQTFIPMLIVHAETQQDSKVC